MKNPAISVIVPTYNRADCIGRAIESVLSQSFTDYELIVVDDGSSDNTEEVIAPYAGRFRYLRQENSGKSSALNHGLKFARGAWIGVLDSDDEYFPLKLRRQMEALEKFPEAGLCFTDAITNGDPRIKGSAFERRRKRFPEPCGIIKDALKYVLSPPHAVYIQTTLIRKELLERIGGFDEGLRVSEDTDMIFLTALETSFVYVREVLTRIDRTPKREDSLTEISETDPTVGLKCKQRMYEKWQALGGRLNPWVQDYIAERLRDVYNEWASWHLTRGRLQQADEALRKCLALGGTWKHFVKRFAIWLAPGSATRFAASRMHERRMQQARLFYGEE